MFLFSMGSMVIMAITKFLCDLIYYPLVQLLNLFSEALFLPFAFQGLPGSDLGKGSEVFLSLISSDLAKSIIDISTSLGIAIAVIILIFSLFKVFYGRVTSDTPDPIKTCIRFVISVFLIYWGINIAYDYVFPFIGSFLADVLSIDITGLGKEIQSTWSEFKLDALTPFEKMKNATVPDQIKILGYAAWDAAGEGISNMLSYGLTGILFVVLLICLTIQLLKLVVESAERYLTVNLLVIGSPIASATLVSKPTSKIFTSFCQLIVSNVLTILFNMFGALMIIESFKAYFHIIKMKGFFKIESFIALIAVFGICKMAQKFDQILAQLTFRLNPITNKDVIMGAVGNVQKIIGLGKTATGMFGGSGSGAPIDTNSITSEGSNNLENSAMSNIKNNANANQESNIAATENTDANSKQTANANYNNEFNNKNEIPYKPNSETATMIKAINNLSNSQSKPMETLRGYGGDLSANANYKNPSADSAISNTAAYLDFGNLGQLNNVPGQAERAASVIDEVSNSIPDSRFIERVDGSNGYCVITSEHPNYQEAMSGEALKQQFNSREN